MTILATVSLPLDLADRAVSAQGRQCEVDTAETE